MRLLRLLVPVCLACLLTGVPVGLAQTPGATVVVKVSGEVKVEKADGQSVAAAPDMALSAGDTIRTGAASAVTLKMGEGNTIALQENASLKIEALPKPAEGVEAGAAATPRLEAKPAPTLNLLSGSLLGRLKNLPKGSKVTIGTSTSMAGIEGTTFSVTATPNAADSTVAVMEGVVLVESRGESNKSVVVGARKMTRVSEWGKTTITATGSGVPSGRYRPIPVFRDNLEIRVARARAGGKTQDEAVKKAREVLSGRILRAKVGPETSVASWLVGKDEAYARLAAFVGGSTIMPAGVLPDGTVEVTAEVNIADLDRVLEQKVPLFEGAVVPVEDLKYSLAIGARERLTAERAATLDAQRKLLETIQGAQITSSTTVQDFALQSDVIRSKVEGVLRGAKTLSTQYFSDGTVEVTLGVEGAMVAEEINRAAQKDVLGRNYLCKPCMMDLPDYEQLRTFEAEQK